MEQITEHEAEHNHRSLGPDCNPMTRLIFLGGFLASGKTTTLLRLAGDLVRAGHKVGVLTNDQGEELVDTELFRASGLDTRDVRGGCFCCRLEDFFAQAARLVSSSKPDFLLAEPVGSCTDLVATVLRPLQQGHRGEYAIAPFTVLVDPLRARNALSREGKATFSEKVTYIYRLQQLEADAIAVNKADTLAPRARDELVDLLHTRFPGKRILSFSAKTGEGFDDLAAWLLGPSDRALPTSPEIDYDTYAQGEAELAWFDGRFGLSAPKPVDMDDALMTLGSLLRARLSAAGLQIAHVKLFLRAGERVCALSVPCNDAPPELSGRAEANASSLDLMVNARVAATPEALREIVEACLRAWSETHSISVSGGTESSFSPSRPVPTRRIG